MKVTDVLPADIIVDNTLLTSVAKCDTQAAMRHVLGLTTEGESANLKAGSDIHEAIALWLSGFTVDEAMAHFKTLYRDWAGEHVAGDDRLSYSNVARILKHWFGKVGAKWPFVVDPAEVEVPLVAELGEIKGRRVVMVALLDAIGKLKTGGRWSIDHKTTKSVSDYFRQDQEYSSQFTGQLWIAREAGYELSGVYVNAIELKTIPGSDRKCSQHGTTYKECGIGHITHDLLPETRPAAEIDAWYQTAVGLVKRFIRLVDKVQTVADVREHAGMQGRFIHGACGNCEFREWCRMGRPKGSAKTFVENPWRPLERAQARVEDVRRMVKEKTC